MLLIFRLLSAVLVLISLGLLFGIGPLANVDYQTFSFMHLLVIASFYSSLSYFKKDVILIATHYDLRRTMEGVVKKTGTTMVQTLTVFMVALFWLAPILLTGLWYFAGRLTLDLSVNGMPFLWSIFSVSACIYLCLLNPILRKKFK